MSTERFELRPDMIGNIQQFHEKFGFEMPDKPEWGQEELLRFRVGFLLEEMDEIIDAVEKNNLPEFFDGLIDLVYVAMGTAYLMGLPWGEGWTAVHEANMQKERTPTEKKVGKPANWQPPDILRVLTDHGYERPDLFKDSITDEKQSFS